MMTKFHINDKGEAKRCKAQPGNCPITKESGGEHYDSMIEAQKDYENSNNAIEKPLNKNSKNKKPQLTKIYRVGSLTPPESHFSDLNDLLETFDSYKPEGRQGRSGGVFASPDMSSHSKWILGSQNNKHEEALNSHEITVDENSVYVYSVESYEEASAYQGMYGFDSEKFKEKVQEFWDNGMTLADWKTWAKENNPEPGSWEIIMPSSSIVSTKKLSNRTVIENVDESYANEVNRILEPERYRNGLIWRKSTLTDEEKNQIKEFALEEFDENFVNDMEKVYAKNAYTVEDAYSASKEIYQQLRKEKIKRNENMKKYSELDDNEVDEFYDKISEYLTIVDLVKE